MRKFLVILLGGLLVMGGCARDVSSVPVPAEAIIQLSDQFTGKFDLRTSKGGAASSEDFKGKVPLVYFGFATCPDVCPTALGTLSAALNELSEDELSEFVPLFITIDPERDTPETLEVYLSPFHARITGLTGGVDAVKSAGEGFKVYAEKQPLEGSALGYTMNHTSFFYLVDRQGVPQVAVRDTVNAQQLASALRAFLRDAA